MDHGFTNHNLKTNRAIEVLVAALTEAKRKDYRAAYALRGTPPRLHNNIRENAEGVRLTRAERKAAARARALENFNRIAAEGVPAIHLNSSRKAA